jgi:hypothetical protein
MMDFLATWNGQDSNMSSAPQDDFQQFLDVGVNSLDDGLIFDFQDFRRQNNGQMLQQESTEATDTWIDVAVGLLEQKDTMIQG